MLCQTLSGLIHLSVEVDTTVRELLLSLDWLVHSLFTGVVIMVVVVVRLTLFLF